MANDKPPIPFPGPMPAEFAGALEIRTQPYEIAGWLPLVDMFCYCQPGHTQVVHMLGLNVPAICPVCHNIYTATGFGPEMQILVSVRKGAPVGQ